MGKIFALVVGLLICCLSNAWADQESKMLRIYPVEEKMMSAATKYGASATSPTGVSPCAVIELGKMYSEGIGSFQWESISGATSVIGVSVWVKCSNINSTTAWALAPRIPIVIGENVVSGATGEPKVFKFPPTYFLRPEMQACLEGVVSGTTQGLGVTPYARMTLRGGAGWADPQGFGITSGISVYSVSSLSGTSSLVTPEGTETIVIAVEDNGIRYNMDGTTPTSDSTLLTAGSRLTISKREARLFRFKGDVTTASKVKPHYYTR
ncbi:MAG: hypothetical protein PHC68_00680 [Syntrophorhabdaceae bacterium]|nr:hypothetical protein [Syntrophorhabdaceae bacterium]